MDGPRRKNLGQRVPQPNPQLFDDTSTQQPMPPYGTPPPQGVDNSQGTPYGNQANMQFAGQPFLSDPMANVAMQYGQDLAGHGQEYVKQHIDKYVSTSKLKYYFAVDTTYVGKKIGLLLFPFAHTDWSIKYNQDEPVAPRYEVNAPDLYIPSMAFVTYVLLAGVVFGTQNRFTPEQLGITCSSALVWLFIEIILLLFTTYIMKVKTGLGYLDFLCYCGYKYVGMILSLLGGLIFQSVGYYLVLLWTSISISFFLVRTLKVAIAPQADPDSYTRGNKRRLYTLLLIALLQPVFMWWLTRHIVNGVKQ